MNGVTRLMAWALVAAYGLAAADLVAGTMQLGTHAEAGQDSH